MKHDCADHRVFELDPRRPPLGGRRCFVHDLSASDPGTGMVPILWSTRAEILQVPVRHALHVFQCELEFLRYELAAWISASACSRV